MGHKASKDAFVIEGYGIFALSAATTTSLPDGDVSGASITTKLANSSGFGGGGALGYAMGNWGIFGSFDYRSIKSREWSTTGGFYIPSTSTLTKTATGTGKIQNTRNTMWIGVGPRVYGDLGPGRIYGGGGVAIILPFTDSTTITASTAAGTTTILQETKYNLAVGGYGEVGYEFEITPMVYVGIAGKFLVSAPTNKGQATTTTTTTAAGSTTTTANNTDTIAATGDTQFGAVGITDMSGVVKVGLRL